MQLRQKTYIKADNCPLKAKFNSKHNKNDVEHFHQDILKICRT